MGPKQNSRTTRTPLADFLRTWRIACNMTQTGLATRLGVTQGAINNYETGQSVPPTLRLAELSRVLGFDLAEALAKITG